MFEKVKKFFKKSNKNEGKFAKLGSKKNEDSIKSSSSSEVTDNSLGSVAGGNQLRSTPKDIG